MANSTQNLRLHNWSNRINIKTYRIWKNNKTQSNRRAVNCATSRTGATVEMRLLKIVWTHSRSMHRSASYLNNIGMLANRSSRLEAIRETLQAGHQRPSPQGVNQWELIWKWNIEIFKHPIKGVQMEQTAKLKPERVPLSLRNAKIVTRESGCHYSWRYNLNSFWLTMMTPDQFELLTELPHHPNHHQINVSNLKNNWARIKETNQSGWAPAQEARSSQKLRALS